MGNLQAVVTLEPLLLPPQCGFIRRDAMRKPVKYSGAKDHEIEHTQVGLHLEPPAHLSGLPISSN